MSSSQSPTPEPSQPTAVAPGLLGRFRCGYRANPLALLLFAWTLLLAILAAAIWLTQSLVKDSWSVEAHFFWRQDVPVLGAMLAITLGLCLAPASWLARLAGRPFRDARWVAAALAATTFAAGAVGVWAVFQGYTFSLDEFLANFDAQIFASGRVAAPIAPAWRPYASAMQPMYMLPLPPSAWASSYLPVNAAMRAAARLIGADWLLNPLLSGFSVIATWAVGRRLWPDRPDLALVAAALLGTSSQLIVMAMTAYAMPAHLAFNLAWLWLFLRGGKLGHAGAIAVGFLATGIHQIAFHPLFVAPFVLQLLWRRRWALSALYIGAYAAICLFWVDYWAIATNLRALAAADSDSTGFDYFLDRIDDLIDAIGYDSVGAMGEMLARFAAWQNLLLAPLAILGAALSIRARGALRPLVLGVFLTLAVMTIATPTQTHGWGYRYMHGLLGSACLAAAYAWGRLTDAVSAERRAGANGAFVLACAISLLALVPAHAAQAARYVAPYAAANAAVQASRADVVVVDHNSQVLFDMGTLVRNDPLLRRRPKVMALAMMTAPMVRQVCADHSVAVFNGASARSFGIDIIPWRPPQRLDELRQLMAQLRCGRTMMRQ